jgi:hypothetical protein
MYAIIALLETDMFARKVTLKLVSVDSDERVAPGRRISAHVDDIFGNVVRIEYGDVLISLLPVDWPE